MGGGGVFSKQHGQHGLHDIRRTILFVAIELFGAILF